MSKKAIFAGSFDPFHKGHQYVVKQALEIFDEIVIVVSKNPNKKYELSFEQRAKLIKDIYKNEPRVSVLINENKLTVQFAKELNIHFLIRGIRNETDAKYELEMAQTNKALDKNIATVFFSSDEENANISSSFIKEVELFKKDK